MIRGRLTCHIHIDIWIYIDMCIYIYIDVEARGRVDEVTQGEGGFPGDAWVWWCVRVGVGGDDAEVVDGLGVGD